MNLYMKAGQLCPQTRPMRLGVRLKVMAGDKVKIGAESFYTLPSGGNPGAPLTMVIGDLLQASISCPSLSGENWINRS
jgi:hypothetical protein